VRVDQHGFAGPRVPRLDDAGNAALPLNNSINCRDFFLKIILKFCLTAGQILRLLSQCMRRTLLPVRSVNGVIT